jgi:pyrimidine-specific ribonucleoside hydrolase
MSKQSFIIDTDADFDDLIAIYWLQKQKDVDIKLITFAGNGWTSPEPGLRNLLNSLAYFGCDDIPVASGAQVILSATHTLPQSTTALADELWGIDIPNSDNKPLEIGAPEAICQTLHAATEPVKILAIGPLTNIAMAIVQSPGIIKKISGIYLTGGNPNQSISESSYVGNERYDIVATRIVYNSGIPICSVPSPTCKPFPVRDPLFDCLHTEELRDAEKYISLLFKHPQEIEENRELYMWDILTAFVAYHERKHTKGIQEQVDIHEAAKHKSELIYEHKTGHTLHMITEIDKQVLVKHFLDTIFEEY